jgi:hypothetical protein
VFVFRKSFSSQRAIKPGFFYPTIWPIISQGCIIRIGYKKATIITATHLLTTVPYGTYIIVYVWYIVCVSYKHYLKWSDNLIFIATLQMRYYDSLCFTNEVTEAPGGWVTLHMVLHGNYLSALPIAAPLTLVGWKRNSKYTQVFCICRFCIYWIQPTQIKNIQGKTLNPYWTCTDNFLVVIL